MVLQIAPIKGGFLCSNSCKGFMTFVYLLVAAALIIIGVMFIIPSQKAKEMAKSHVGWVVIGCGIVLGALTFAKEISSKFIF